MKYEDFKMQELRLDTCNTKNPVPWSRPGSGIRLSWDDSWFDWPFHASISFFYKMSIRATLLGYYEDYFKGICIWSVDHNYYNAFSWKSKGLKGPQVTILSIVNNTLAHVRLLTTVSHVTYRACMWTFWSWSGIRIIIGCKVPYETYMALKTHSKHHN